MATKQQRDRQRRALAQRTRELAEWTAGGLNKYKDIHVPEDIRQAKIDVATNDVMNLQEKLGI